MKDKLTEQEVMFCQLYVNGVQPYLGDLVESYKEAFGINKSDKLIRQKAKELINKEDVREYIKELSDMSSEEAAALKQFLTENLINIIKETSTAVYRDRRGTKLSPAPLRSVAVNASKALMDMYPIKEAQVNKLNIEGSGEGGITFNVIVPEQKPTVPENE